MKTYTHIRQYLAELFFEWQMFQTKVVEKIKTHNFFSDDRGTYKMLRENAAVPGRPQMATV